MLEPPSNIAGKLKGFAEMCQQTFAKMKPEMWLPFCQAASDLLGSYMESIVEVEIKLNLKKKIIDKPFL